jgi:hypothetical protein
MVRLLRAEDRKRRGAAQVVKHVQHGGKRLGAGRKRKALSIDDAKRKVDQGFRRDGLSKLQRYDRSSLKNYWMALLLSPAIQKPVSIKVDDNWSYEKNPLYLAGLTKNRGRKPINANDLPVAKDARLIMLIFLKLHELVPEDAQAVPRSYLVRWIAAELVKKERINAFCSEANAKTAIRYLGRRGLI